MTPYYFAMIFATGLAWVLLIGSLFGLAMLLVGLLIIGPERFRRPKP